MDNITQQQQTKNSLHWSWEQVAARRMDRNGLTASLADATPAGSARAMCGAHAQIISAAELSIGLRLPHATRTGVQHALWEERSLIKTYGPRGTVHLLPAQDLPMWTGALSTTPYATSADARSELLTAEQADIIVQAIAGVLEEAELTTDELTEALVKHVGSWAGEPVMEAFQTKWPRWRLVQSIAGVRGAMCFGPNRGRNVTYTSPRRWLPGFQPMEQGAALAELVRSYLHAYGPATPQQFAKWIAVPATWATQLFTSLAEHLDAVVLNGVEAWVWDKDVIVPAHGPSGVRLLPYFDAFVIGSHPRELLYPGPAAQRALNGGQAGNYPVLLVDGVVAGVWHQRRSGKKLAITVEPLEPLSQAQRQELDEQVQRIGQILEGTPSLTIGPVTTGPHA